MHWPNLFQRCLRRNQLTACLLLFLAGIGAGATPTLAQDEGNLYDTAFDVREGESYFQRQCSRCHGQDAKGNDETGAPDLTGNLRRASTDAGIFSDPWCCSPMERPYNKCLTRGCEPITLILSRADLSSFLSIFKPLHTIGRSVQP